MQFSFVTSYGTWHLQLDPLLCSVIANLAFANLIFFVSGHIKINLLYAVQFSEVGSLLMAHQLILRTFKDVSYVTLKGSNS